MATNGTALLYTGVLFEVHIGNTTVFRVAHRRIADGSILNIEGVTVQEYRFFNPKKVETVLPAMFCTDGTDGLNQVKALPTFLDFSGVWCFLSHLEQPGDVWDSDFYYFEVVANVPRK